MTDPDHRADDGPNEDGAPDRDVEVRDVLPRDAIPSVDDPAFVADYGGPAGDDVVVVERGDEARAYPVRYLHYHEIVNDEVAGDPLAVTWCPLCGSAVVYDRRVVVDRAAVDDSARTESGATGGDAADATGAAGDDSAGDDGPDERVLEFGVSGRLADDDLVMYDRETGSEWKQSLGVAIDGPLAGTELTALPAGLTSWASFRDAHPDGVVLAPPGGASEAASDDDEPAPVDYDADPYEAYFDAAGFGLDAHRGDGPGRGWDRDDVAPKEPVLGVTVDDEAVGFPRSVVDDAGGTVAATVGDRGVLVVLGEALHAYDYPGFEFDVHRVHGRSDVDRVHGRSDRDGEDVADTERERGKRDDEEGQPGVRPGGTERVLRGDGTRWDPATGRSADGRRLDRLPARRLFAFAWQDDHGPDSFYGLPDA